jgi:hypothetical protein
MEIDVDVEELLCNQGIKDNDALDLEVSSEPASSPVFSISRSFQVPFQFFGNFTWAI